MNKALKQVCNLLTTQQTYTTPVLADCLLIIDYWSGEYLVWPTGSESLKSLVDMQTQKSLAAPCPLLQAVVTMDRAVSSLRQLTTDLPSYADQFLDMLCNILKDYKETCYATYRGTRSMCLR